MYVYLLNTTQVADYIYYIYIYILYIFVFYFIYIYIYISNSYYKLSNVRNKITIVIDNNKYSKL